MLSRENYPPFLEGDEDSICRETTDLPSVMLLSIDLLNKMSRYYHDHVLERHRSKLYVVVSEGPGREDHRVTVQKSTAEVVA